MKIIMKNFANVSMSRMFNQKASELITFLGNKSIQILVSDLNVKIV